MAYILVTDDSSFLRRITCGILKRAGHRIVEAVDGVECLQLIAQEKPDVVFLDLVMPVMDGMAVLKTLQEQNHAGPVIVLTADIQETVRQECLQMGARFFLNKPPKEADVLQALEGVLEQNGENT